MLHVQSDIERLEDLEDDVRALRAALDEMTQERDGEHRARVKAERRYADLLDACQGILDVIATPAFKVDP